MIAKKNSRLDLERKRTALFAVGLLTAGSFTLAAFTYESAHLVKSEKERVAHQDINYMIQDKEVEEEKQLEPVETETQQNDQDQSNAQMEAHSNPDENSTSSENSNEASDAGVGMDQLPFEFGEDVPDVKINIDFDIPDWVDKEAEFVGGYPEMMRFINTNVRYPEDAIEIGEQGRVYLNFIVEKDGSITNISVEKSVCRSLDREAKRIVRSFPKWIPAELNAKKVRARVRLPIVFVLEE